MMNPGQPFQLLPLRRDLQFTLHGSGDSRWYSLQDPLSGQFYRLGLREYSIACQIAANETSAELAQRLTADSAWCPELERPVSAAEIEQLATWLIRAGLCQTSRTRQVKAVYNRWVWNPLSIRLPLLSGHRLEIVARPIAKCCSPAAILGLLVLYVVALCLAVSNWETFSFAFDRLFVADSHLWWLGAWLILKLVHELGHAVAALRLNSHVRSAGLNIIFFAPIPYVDVSDLWTIPNRWHRISVSAAGILAELTLASIAVIVAVSTTNESLKYLCCALAVTGTVTTLAFNANPLMRFDGYYIVSDLISIPNLWSRSQGAVQAWLLRLIQPWKAGHAGLPFVGFAIYGATTMLYRVVVMVTMAATAILVWGGFGVVMVIWAGMALYVRPWIKSFGDLLSKLTNSKSGFGQWAAPAIVIAGILATMAIMPSPVQPSVPAVIGYSQPVLVNAEAEGVLTELLVRVGDRVEPGQRIAVLRDADLHVELSVLELQVQSVRESLRSQQARGDLADLQASQVKLSSLETQLEQMTNKVQRLTICASHAGTIVQLAISDCMGKNITIGEPVCLIASSAELEATGSVSQRDWHAFQRAQGAEIRLRSIGDRAETGRIDEVELQGRQYLSEPILAACYHGPIPVELERGQESGADRWRLFEPRFDVHVRLGEDTRFRPGQVVWLSVPGAEATVLNVARSWIGGRWQQLQHQTAH